MRPAIDGDRRDVARGRKAAGPEHAIEIAADIRFEIGEGHVQQFHTADAELVARFQSRIGIVRHMHEMQAHRLGRIARDGDSAPRLTG